MDGKPIEITEKDTFKVTITRPKDMSDGEWLALLITSECPHVDLGACGRCIMVFFQKNVVRAGLRLDEPTRAVKAGSGCYLAIIEDANGVRHFWLPDGSYDGYCRPCGDENEQPEGE